MNRELDAEVARRLFLNKPHLKGYRFVENPDSLSDKDETWFWYHPKDGILIGESWTTKLMEGKYDHQWRKFEPSSAIRDTNVVLGFLHDSNKAITITNTLNAHGNNWFVSLGKSTFEEKTIEMAVCMAVINE